MKTALKLPLLTLFASQVCSAVEFDFTAGEGFTSGDLNGQLGWVAPAGSVLVNTDPGKEFVFSAGGQNSTYGGGTFDPTASTLTFTTDFTFNATLDANKDVLNVIKLTGPSNSDVARVYFRYVDSAGDYRMRYSRGNGFDLDVQTSNVFTLGDVGQGAADAQSDDLRVTWSLTRGVDASSWTSALSLVNITNGNTAIDINYTTGTVWETTVAVSEDFHNSTSIQWGFGTQGTNNANILYTSAVPEPANFALISCLSLLAFLGFRRAR